MSNFKKNVYEVINFVTILFLAVKIEFWFKIIKLTTKKVPEKRRIRICTVCSAVASLLGMKTIQQKKKNYSDEMCYVVLKNSLAATNCIGSLFLGSMTNICSNSL